MCGYAVSATDASPDSGFRARDKGRGNAAESTGITGRRG